MTKPNELPHIQTRSAALQALLDEAEADITQAERDRPASRIPAQSNRSAVGGARARAAQAASAALPIGAQRLSTESAQHDLITPAATWEAPGARRSRVTREFPRVGAGGHRRATRSGRVSGPSRGRRRRGRLSPKAPRTRSRTHSVVAGYGLLRLGRPARMRSAQVRRLIRGVAAPPLAAPIPWSTPPVPPTATVPPTPTVPPTATLAAASPHPRATFAPSSPAEVAAEHFARAPLSAVEVTARENQAHRAEHPRRRALVVSSLAVAAVVAAVVLIAWQLGRDRTPDPPASPVSATSPAAPTPALTSATSATPAPVAVATPSGVAVVKATGSQAPTSAAAPRPQVLPIPSGPTSVRPGDDRAGTVVPGATRLTGWVVEPTTP